MNFFEADGFQPGWVGFSVAQHVNHIGMVSRNPLRQPRNLATEDSGNIIQVLIARRDLFSLYLGDIQIQQAGCVDKSDVAWREFFPEEIGKIAALIGDDGQMALLRQVARQVPFEERANCVTVALVGAVEANGGVVGVIQQFSKKINGQSGRAVLRGPIAPFAGDY